MSFFPYLCRVITAMKVIEHLASAKNPLVSVEIIPPRRGGNIGKIHQAIESILPFNPPFIDVTSHSAEVIYDERADGTYRRIVKRKSPGTFGLCAAIKYKYNVDPVPHILCNGFTREETEDALIELNYLGVENLLLIRGDTKYSKPVREGRSSNQYAHDLVSQVSNMNKGIYLDDLMDVSATDFCIGVAAYPEKHIEAPNLKFDLEILHKKQEAGAHYACSQMFFDNKAYFEFVRRAKDMGITIPIIPGLKILTKKAQLNSLPAIFFTNFPEDLTDQLIWAENDRAVLDIGIQWAVKQSVELLEQGVPSLHYYIMQDTTPFLRFMKEFSKYL